ncbi:MAG: beta galactosidase jelly roll domain-containing protein [Candidatus Solibacter usitatus]|nr:beta galactosidase jelly roll domain-containing protein [Candidatus Solibacter usitatus]
MLTWTCRAWLLLAPLALPAQDAVVTLDKWKVHDGDDARWASPGFDDTNWKASKAPEIYYSFNPFQAGFRWYRTRIELPSTLAGQPLALAVGPMDEAYEVYVEGVRAGGVGLIGVGLIKEKPEGRFEQHAAFLLPDGVSHSPRLRIAIRRWAGRGITSFAIFRARSNAGRHAPQIGRAAVISLRETIHTMDDTTASPARFVGWFLLFAGLLSLALFSTHQDRAEYLWLGLGLSTAGLGAVAGVAVAGLENLPRRAWIAVWIAGSPHIASLFSALLLRQLCPRLRQLLTAVAAIHFLDACYLMTAFRFGLPFDPQILNVGSVVTLGTQFAVAVLLGLSGLGYRLALAGSLVAGNRGFSTFGLRSGESLSAGARSGWGFLSIDRTARRRVAGSGGRRERQGSGGGDGGGDSSWRAAHVRDRPARTSACDVESLTAAQCARRIRDLLLRAVSIRWRGDAGQCRSSRAVSCGTRSHHGSGPSVGDRE